MITATNYLAACPGVLATKQQTTFHPKSQRCPLLDFVKQLHASCSWLPFGQFRLVGSTRPVAHEARLPHINRRSAGSAMGKTPDVAASWYCTTPRLARCADIIMFAVPTLDGADLIAFCAQEFSSVIWDTRSSCSRQLVTFLTQCQGELFLLRQQPTVTEG